MKGRLRLSILAALLFSLGSVARGHAVLLSAKPSAGEEVSGPDTSVTLRFNSRVDAKRSMLILVAPGGEMRKLVIGEQSSPDSLDSRVKGLKSGSYILRWQVLAIDGHITRGEVPFRVRTA